MKISKTMFKEYTRCNRVCALDDIYMKKLNTNISPFQDDDYHDLLELIHLMFDRETGDDLINITDLQHEALLPYYQRFEAIAMSVAEKIFKSGIIYHPDTKKQKRFAYFDNANHELYCYLDGFQELENEVRIFEVKATTSRKFQELGPKIANRQYSIFDTQNNIMKITEDPQMSDEKFVNNYQKLFDRYSSCGKYVYDLAVERYIIENSCKQFQLYQNKTFKYYLVVLNSNYTYQGQDNEFIYNPDDDGNEIVTFIDLTDVTFQYLSEIRFNHRKLQNALADLNPNPVDLGLYCQRNNRNECLFFNICWKKVVEKGSILEYLQNHHGFTDEIGEKRSTIDLINQGYHRIDSIPRSWLKRKNNIIQRDCYDNQNEYIHYAKIIKGINYLKYPIYYLDFESFNSPLPRFRGERPYEQSVFQYSLHIEKAPNHCDYHHDHRDYLAPNFQDHRLELVERLLNDIDLSNGGTVIVYNKKFEKQRLQEFIKLFPQHQKKLQQIIDHLFDLLYIVANNKNFYLQLGFDNEDASIINYYHNDLMGSYSIKRVLPLFSNLSYDDLDIKNGVEAIIAYSQFENLLPEESQEVQNNLRHYCKQDTWAMYLILQGLKKKVGII